LNCKTEEIILIDDFSSFDYLEEKLEIEVSRLPKVKLIRNKKREGLIRTRLIGSKIAKGKTITFLECHIECNEGWLEPLLDQIAENEMIYAIPVITVIDNKTFEFKHNPESDPQIGIFDWNMGFNWASIPEDSLLKPSGQILTQIKSFVNYIKRVERKSVTESISSPTMAGGLFTVLKKTFYDLGAYDKEGFLII